MSEIKRKLATIEKISEIHPIEGADAIERAVIRGWNVVIKKGEFKEGDLCVYCEIDSLMPDRPEFEFLKPRGFRIKTIKLRGQVSQGIAFPLSILDFAGSYYIETGYLTIEKDGKKETIDVGSDVTDYLGVTKYDPPIPACLGGVAKGNFPSHSIKTDEERIQNLVDNYEMYRTNFTWIATEKVDGSSVTYSIWNNEFGVASRNLALKENETNSFWKVARELNIELKMRQFMLKHKLESLTIQGELLGEGIQKNKYRIKGQTVRFFRVFDPIKYEFFSGREAINAIEEMGLEFVPIIEEDMTLPDTVQEVISLADGRSKLYETAREGIVFVADTPIYPDIDLSKYQGRLSFKVISNKFILKHDA